MLESVRIQRFKSIADATIPLGRVTLLVGPNNAGKSSILQAIQFATSVSQSLTIDGVSKWSADGLLSGTLSTQQLIYTPLRDLNALAKGGSLRQDASTAINVTLTDAELGPTEVTVKRGKNKNISVQVSGSALGQRMADLDHPYSVVAPGLAGIPAMEEFRSPSLVRRAAARGDANSVFRNVLWTLVNDKHKWAEFETLLEKVFPDVELAVTFDQNTDEHIIAWVKREDGPWLPIESAGTGVLQAVQVLSYIGVYGPTLLILDEPDAHLHPDNQRRLARLLDHLTRESELQVLLSTHSRHLLDEFEGLGATTHWVSSGELQDESFDRVGALLDLGALDAGDRLRTGQRSVVVLTEDVDTKYLETLLVSSGIDAENFDIWSYKGSSKVESAEALAKFIQGTAPKARILVHRDRDYLSDEDVASYEARIVKLGLTPFVTTGTDIESHSLRADYLAELHPSINEADFVEILSLATAGTRQRSIEIMIDERTAVANRRRNNPGSDAQPRAGAISTQSYADFDASPERYRHGKTTLGVVRRILQERKVPQRAIGSTPSERLRVPAIADFWEKGDATETPEESPPSGD